jgi:ribosomal protein L29
VQGDRAHALDSYRMAASGFRKSAAFAKTTDEAGTAKDGLSKATDGVAACQSRFASQYQHPGTGRVKVCDSASTALRTAVERTRAGEVVSVIGKTVRPGRARVCDSREGVWMCSECKTGHTSETELHKHQEKTGHWRTPTGNPLTKEEAGHSQWQAKDGAFAKLEGKLEKEGESKRKASGTDLINAHTWSVSELNSTLAELQRALKDARTPGKPQYGGNTRQIEEDIADAKRALASKSSAKDGAFAKLEGKLEKEGESKQEAGGVAYEAGAAKYGKAGMAAKSAAARDDDTEELAQRIKSLVKELKADGTTNMSTRNLKQLVNTRGLRFANQNHFERAFSEALAKAGVAKFVAMAEEAGRTKAKDSREVQPV